MATLRIGLTLALAAACTQGLVAAELQDETIAAWNRYVEATERRIAGELAAGGRFLVQDFRNDADDARRDVLAGNVRIDRMETRDADSQGIRVPKGAIHHWRGSVLIPGATLDAVLHGLMHGADLTRMQNGVVESRVLDRDGYRLHVFLKLRRKQLVTVHYNTEHRVRYTRHPSGHRVEPQRVDPDRGAGRRRIACGARETDRTGPGVHVAVELLLALPADRRRRHRRVRVGEPEPLHSARHSLDGDPHRQPHGAAGDDADADVDGRRNERPGPCRKRDGRHAGQPAPTGRRERTRGGRRRNLRYRSRKRPRIGTEQETVTQWRTHCNRRSAR